jgi:hypothetical protein
MTEGKALMSWQSAVKPYSGRIEAQGKEPSRSLHSSWSLSIHSLSTSHDPI